jgi:hypothetical protein
LCMVRQRSAARSKGSSSARLARSWTSPRTRRRWSGPWTAWAARWRI